MIFQAEKLNSTLTLKLEFDKYFFARVNHQRDVLDFILIVLIYSKLFLKNK